MSTGPKAGAPVPVTTVSPRRISCGNGPSPSSRSGAAESARQAQCRRRLRRQPANEGCARMRTSGSPDAGIGAMVVGTVRCWRQLASIAAVLLSAGVGRAQSTVDVYRCVDPTGAVSLQDHPCPPTHSASRREVVREPDAPPVAVAPRAENESSPHLRARSLRPSRSGPNPLRSGAVSTSTAANVSPRMGGRADATCRCGWWGAIPVRPRSCSGGSGRRRRDRR
jgi:hypothetical protein